MNSKEGIVQIALELSTVDLLSYIAKKEHKSMNQLLKALVHEALDAREDMHLSKMADEINIDDHVIVSHDEAWK